MKVAYLQPAQETPRFISMQVDVFFPPPFILETSV